VQNSTGRRLPKVGEIVQYYSLFLKDRLNGIVVEIHEPLPTIGHEDLVYFSVMTNEGKLEKWNELEWNYPYLDK